MIVDYGIITSRGNVREKNEDDFYYFGNTRGACSENKAMTVSEKESVVAVFDGVGGMCGGEKASALIAETVRGEVRESFPKDEHDLVKMVYSANEKLCSEMKKSGVKFGSTLAMLLITDGTYYICNVGDSPIFLLHGGELRQISVNHTEEENFRKISGIAADGPRKELTQYVGIFPEEMEIEPYAAHGRAESGDKFIICTDGITNAVSNDDIRSAMVNNDSAYGISKRLADNAMQKGGKDNITVISAVVKEMS